MSEVKVAVVRARVGHHDSACHMKGVAREVHGHLDGVARL
jgi:hypothetical protein